MAITCPVVRIERVDPLGENLSQVVTSDGDILVANRLPDGGFRWRVGELAAYIPVNAIVPFDVLEHRGYKDPDAKKGLLGGSKGNRVAPRSMAGAQSRGLLFKADAGDGFNRAGGVPSYALAELGEDMATFFGITEYVPAP